MVIKIVFTWSDFLIYSEKISVDSFSEHAKIIIFTLKGAVHSSGWFLARPRTVPKQSCPYHWFKCKSEKITHFLQADLSLSSTKQQETSLKTQVLEFSALSKPLFTSRKPMKNRQKCLPSPKNITLFAYCWPPADNSFWLPKPCLPGQTALNNRVTSYFFRYFIISQPTHKLVASGRRIPEP